MNELANDMSPRAFRTIIGKNGAVGARLIRSNPAACPSASGRTLIKEPGQRRSDHPAPEEDQPNGPEAIQALQRLALIRFGTQGADV